MHWLEYEYLVIAVCFIFESGNFVDISCGKILFSSLTWLINLQALPKVGVSIIVSTYNLLDIKSILLQSVLGFKGITVANETNKRKEIGKGKKRKKKKETKRMNEGNLP